MISREKFLLKKEKAIQSFEQAKQQNNWGVVEHITSPICATCKHFNKRKPKEKATCRAFPDGIPEDILSGKISHLEHIEGDRGYKYEPNETMKQVVANEKNNKHN